MTKIELKGNKISEIRLMEMFIQNKR